MMMMMTMTTVSAVVRGGGVWRAVSVAATSRGHSSLLLESCGASSSWKQIHRPFTTSSSSKKSSASSPSNSTTTTNMLWQIATLAAVGTTFVVVGNYFSSPSWRYDDDDGDEKNPVKPPQAEITSRAYFDITIDSLPVGRIVMGLHGNVVPRTVHNFETICRGGTGGGGSSENKNGQQQQQKVGNIKMTYEGSTFHRIIPQFMIQGGEKPGRSVYKSIHYDGRFNDENFQLKHIGPGILSMANSGPNTNGSQFFITTARTSHLDGRHVVFGTVVDGYDVVQLIEACGTSSGKPRKRVVIAKSGVLDDEEEQEEGEGGNNKQ